MIKSVVGEHHLHLLSSAKVEAIRRIEQERLDRLKDAGERNRLGQFATPNVLALAITAHLLRLRGDQARPLRFLDPAVGSGSFYSALLQVAPPGLISEACGIELDSGFAEVAARLWGSLGLRLTVGDFTRLDPPLPGRRADLILANPPYVRHHHLGLLEKSRLRDLIGQRLGVKVSGLAGLYVHFLLLCDSWLEDGGLATWLIPSEFMDVNYGSALRDYLTGRVRLRQIHRFQPADGQFADALVTTAVVIFEKVRPDGSDTALMSYGGPLDAPDQSQLVPLAELRLARKWTNYPRSKARPADRPGSTTALGDLFTIRRGLVTGSNEFFILTRDEARRRGLPPEFLRPILPGPRYLQGAIIEADDSGDPIVDRPRVLVDCTISEAEVRRDYPALWAYFEEGQSRGLHERYITSRRSPWYHQERRVPPPFVCTYMGRQRAGRPPFRILWNRSKAIAANVYLLLYPKNQLALEWNSRLGLDRVVFELLREIRPASFLEAGRVYGGGLHKMEPRELASLPADAIARALGLEVASRQHL